MRALLKYALLKGRREHFLTALLFTPSLVVLAPVLAFGVVAMVRGHEVYPFTIPAGIGTSSGMSPAASAKIFSEVVLFLSVILAGSGSFWVFRSEVATKGTGLFLLARQPLAVVMATTAFGAAGGVASFLFGTAVIRLFMATVPADFPVRLAAAIAGSVVAAAVGTLCVAVSPDLPMMLPVYLASFIAGGVMMDEVETPEQLPLVAAVYLGVAVILSLTATPLWRRRCAA